VIFWEVMELRALLAALSALFESLDMKSAWKASN